MTLAEILSISQSVEVQRSRLHFADYNPRRISPEGKKALKKSIKTFGVVGGIVVNKRTGYTVVSGHQKIAILDEISKGQDYTIRVELIDVDVATEKALNVALNNPNVGGEWDYDKLAELVPDIDWQSAGLTEADLSVIGVDYVFETEGVEEMSNQLEELYDLANPKKEKPKKTVEELVATKQEVKQEAVKKAEKMDAYVVLSFENLQNRDNFLQRFGYSPTQQYIKGEDFDNKCDVVYD